MARAASKQQRGDGTPPVTPAPSVFETGRMYRVRVSRVVEAGALRITPKHGAIVLGEVAETFADAIASFEPAPSADEGAAGPA